MNTFILPITLWEFFVIYFLLLLLKHALLQNVISIKKACLLSFFFLCVLFYISLQVKASRKGSDVIYYCIIIAYLDKVWKGLQ